MDYYKSFVRRIYGILLVLTILGSAVLFITNHEQYIAGWLWGNFGNGLYFFLLSEKVKKVPGLPLKESIQAVRGSFISRLAILVFIVIVASFFPTMKLLAVLLGLLMLKPAIYIDYILFRRQENE